MTVTRSMFDTAEIIIMVERSLAIDAEVTALRVEQRSVDEKIDKARRALRPTYPTVAQRTALALVAVHIRSGVNHGDHLGQNVDAGVRVDGRRGWFHVNAEAPYGRGSSRLWDFTDEEIADMVEYMRTLGVEIVEQWRSDGGSSFVGRPIEGWVMAS